MKQLLFGSCDAFSAATLKNRCPFAILLLHPVPSARMIYLKRPLCAVEIG